MINIGIAIKNVHILRNIDGLLRNIQIITEGKLYYISVTGSDDQLFLYDNLDSPTVLYKSDFICL